MRDVNEGEAGAREWLTRFVQMERAEARRLLLAFAYFFFLLASYYVLRPVRDEMGVRSGVGNLPWLFAASFLVSLAVAPLYAGLVAGLARRVFIPLIYGFLTLNIVAFRLLLELGITPVATSMAYFVWLSVFNVFAVSVFWSFMADLFDSEQAKRQFPIIAAGGSLGGFAGSSTAAGLATLVGTSNLLLIAAALLVGALTCAVVLDRLASDRADGARSAEAPSGTGGSWLEGGLVLVRSAYLRRIAFWVFTLSLAGTIAYFMQAQIVRSGNLSPDERTRLFATIDLAANVLAPLFQLFVTPRLLQRFGVGPALGVVAFVFAIGFVALAVAPVIGVLMVFQITQRTAQFAVSNPAREALFTVVARENKYKAKNVIDNAVFRGADVLNSWIYSILTAGLGLGISAVALIAAPLMFLWLAMSLVLGRAQSDLAGARERRSSGKAESLEPA